MNYLHYITVGKPVRRIGIAIAKDGAVVLDDNEAGVDAERSQKLRHGAIPRNIPGSAVYRQRDDLARFRSPNHKSKYSG